MTKLEAEKYVLRNNGLVFRLGTLFGLGDDHSRIRLDLVVNYLTLKALSEKKITVFGGNQWRPVIAVRDVAGYLAEAVATDFVGIFNVKYKNVKIIDLAKTIAALFPGVIVKTTERKLEDLRNYRVNSEKVEKYFKFKPTTTIEEEVKRMTKVFKERRIKNVDDDIYYNTHYVKKLLYNNLQI
jgi:nucleoside-diphosphate-sugar epimerase